MVNCRIIDWGISVDFGLYSHLFFCTKPSEFVHLNSTTSAPFPTQPTMPTKSSNKRTAQSCRVAEETWWSGWTAHVWPSQRFITVISPSDHQFHKGIMDGEPARLITPEALDEKQQVKFMNKRWKVLSHVVRKRGNTLVIAVTCGNFHWGWALICFLASIRHCNWVNSKWWSKKWTHSYQCHHHPHPLHLHPPQPRNPHPHQPRHPHRHHLHHFHHHQNDCCILILRWQQEIVSHPGYLRSGVYNFCINHNHCFFPSSIIERLHLWTTST